uniref:Myb-like domain-containing protein n=1 Tax=Davidia involucrata TaxID=16924 RepID=A0A5B7AA07_DAVIN
MVQKRPFGDEELYKPSSKHPRQLEYSNQLVSVLEFVPSDNAAQKPQTSGEGEGSFAKSKTDDDEKIASQIITELPECSDKDIETSGCISNSSWATSSTSEEDARSKAPFHLLLSPEYYNPGRPIRALIYSEEIYHPVLEYPPQKLVSIGPDFQADVPEWRPQGTKSTANCSDLSDPTNLSPQASESNLVDGNSDENKLAGICVIPSPESEPSTYNGNKVGDGRTDCCCQDAGSVRCVRQHIMEAREKLKRTLGKERFEELGFSDMGEVVAEKWSEEEEHLFHEVVFSNPASLGKKFWDHLSMAFPFRTKKNIVSYYFNVFLLQRRAEQNRCDPMNIDSDNDEWQGSDDSGDDEFGTIEEDEDSVIESPVYHDDPGHNEIQGDESHEYDEGVAHATCDHYENVDFGSEKGITNVSETCPMKLLDNRSSGPPLQHLPGKILWDVGVDHDAQDDSCTSSDTGAAPRVAQVKANNSKPWLGSFNGINGGGGHDYALEHCDSKVWDVGYLTCPKNEVDFLPTCNMIEEVFGVGAWNCKTRDGKSLN